MREHESAERIKKVAMKLFNDKGYEASTIRDICNVIEITAPSFYYYFDSKSQLYLHMLKECSELHQGVIDQAIEQCPSQIAEDRLKYIFLALLRFYQEHPDEYTFLIRNNLFPVASLKKEVREQSNVWEQQFFRQIAGFLDGSQKRRMPKMEQSKLLTGFHRFMAGYVLQLLIGLVEDGEIAHDEAWDMFWNGIT